MWEFKNICDIITIAIGHGYDTSPSDFSFHLICSIPSFFSVKYFDEFLGQFISFEFLFDFFYFYLQNNFNDLPISMQFFFFFCNDFLSKSNVAMLTLQNFSHHYKKLINNNFLIQIDFWEIKKEGKTEGERKIAGEGEK